MRISIISDGYRYTDNIDKIKQPPVNTDNREAVSDADFGATLKEIQQLLNTKINSLESEEDKATESQSAKTSQSSWKDYTGGVPEVNSEKSESVINVPRTTSSEYTSIAPPEYQSIFKEASQTYGIDQKLLELIGYHESRFRPDVVSSAGAVGIMQLMPGTAKSHGVTDSYDARQNIMGGAKLLSELHEAYNGDLDLMLAGYSAGMGAVRKHNGVPPYEETTNYIDWIRQRYP